MTVRGEACILWRRVDAPGHEFARLSPRGDGWRLAGGAVFLHDQRPCRLAYDIACDNAWTTSRATIEGWIGSQRIETEITRDGGGWRMNGVPHPALDECTDIDLNFSPSTNLLPIRRLRLAVGAHADVHAAWLRFPSFALERLPQRYQRIDAATYRYESPTTDFVADLPVNEFGFVARYPGFFEQIATA